MHGIDLMYKFVVCLFCFRMFFDELRKKPVFLFGF